MSPLQQLTLAVVAHNLGSIILVGSFLFLYLAYLPAVADVRTPVARMRLRLDGIALCFRWSWLGVLLVYSSGIWAAFVLLNPRAMPLHVIWMTVLSGLLLVLLAVADLGLLRLARGAMKRNEVRAARQLYGWLYGLALAVLLVAVCALLLGVSGAVLVS